MGRFFIEYVKCGISEGGIACAPVDGSANASVKISDGDNSYWLSVFEIYGIPNFYVSEDDLFDMIMNSSDEEAIIETLNDNQIDEFEGISLGEYGDIVESIKLNEGSPAVALIKYVVLLTRCPTEEMEETVALAKGKFVDDLDIPASDILR